MILHSVVILPLNLHPCKSGTGHAGYSPDDARASENPPEDAIVVRPLDDTYSHTFEFLTTPCTMGELM